MEDDAEDGGALLPPPPRYASEEYDCAGAELP
jgi:hypothetical protein